MTSLSVTPEGDRLLTAGRDKVANLWNLTSCKKLATVPVFEAVEGEPAHCSACRECSWPWRLRHPDTALAIPVHSCMLSLAFYRIQPYLQSALLHLRFRA